MTNHRIAYDTYPPARGTRSKWEILQERLAFVAAEHKRLIEQMVGMTETPCGLRCAGCDTMLETEEDFARHFIVPDENYLNLGDCPANRRNI